MRQLILILLTVTTFNVLGQDKDLQGVYSREIFMHKYSLILQDSGRYTIREISDLESMTVTGSWTVHNNVITLMPTKGWRERAPERERIEIQWQWLKPSSLKVEDNNSLTELSLLTNADGMKAELKGNTLRREIIGQSK